MYLKFISVSKSMAAFELEMQAEEKANEAFRLKKDKTFEFCLAAIKEDCWRLEFIGDEIKSFTPE